MPNTSQAPPPSSDTSRPVSRLPRYMTNSSVTETPRGPEVNLMVETLPLIESVRFSDAYGRWLRLAGRDSSARIEQHPDCVLRDLPYCDGDMVKLPPVALFANPSESPRESLAAGILVPKDVSTNSLGGLGLPWKLRGYRVVGNSLLGWRGNDIQRLVLDAALTWVDHHHADFLLVEDVDQRSALWSLLEAGCERGFTWSPTSQIQPRFRVRFPVPVDDYWRKFSPKTQNTLRRKAKAIGRSRLVRVTEPDQVPEFLEYVQTVVQRSQSAGKMPSRVARDQRELQSCLLLADHRWLRSYVLIVDGTPAAYVIGYQNRDGYRIKELKCDPRFADRSPEVVIVYRLLQDLIKHETPQIVDLGWGNSDFQRLYGNEIGKSADVLLVRQSRCLNFGLAYLRTCHVIRTISRLVVEGIRDCEPFQHLHIDAGSGRPEEEE
ncbi:MAG: GNAT family N-acetyltransferase [Planctomycetales bacterium]|nr:GNAT family N-acetyltransferase [Planctomycetales bacterium]